MVVRFGRLDRPDLPLAGIIITSTMTPKTKSSQPTCLTLPAQDDPIARHIGNAFYEAQEQGEGSHRSNCLVNDRQGAQFTHAP